MNELKYKDQAVSLRNEVNSKEDPLQYNTSSLPSRKEVHGKKKQKIVWKVKFPLVKILVLFFVLLIITTLAIYTHLTKDNQVNGILGNDNPSYSEEIKGYDSYDSIDDKEKLSNDVTDKAIASNQDEDNKTDSKTNQMKENESEKKETEKSTNKDTSKPAITEKNETVNENNTKPNIEDKKEQKVIEHTVQPSETVYRIAMKYYSSTSGIEKIKQYNGLSDNNIRVGQVLQIPLEN